MSILNLNRAGTSAGLALTAATLLSGATVALSPTASAATLVNPTAPSFTDSCGSTNDTYTIPVTTGVDYYDAGVKVNAGIRKVDPSSPFVQVFAVAQPGYVLSQSASWSHLFNTGSKDSDTGCVAKTTAVPTNSIPALPTVTGTTSAPSPSSSTMKTLPHTGFEADSYLTAFAFTGVGALALGGAAFGVGHRKNSGRHSASAPDDTPVEQD
ncbi:LPXTG cell wall anchor domain-containing protein [Branchiibius cervicis]|uniref:LPXTG cell wall anchor domain-containing protein n=1 Tax=Branchiibius cervicis TaxID=908252 RepID=A0ABW2AV85_9MICO